MSPIVLGWILSIVGAAAFAAAGWLQGEWRERRRGNDLQAIADAELSDLRSRCQGLEEMTATMASHHRSAEVARESSAADLEGAVAALEDARAEIATLRDDGARARSESRRAAEELGKARTALSEARADLAKAHADLAQARNDGIKLQQTLARSLNARDAAARDYENLVRERRKLEAEHFGSLTELEALRQKAVVLESTEAEKRALADELSEAQRRLESSCDAEVALGLRHDLRRLAEALRSLGADAERLRDENAKLRQSAGEVDVLRRHIDTLNDELSSLRASAFAASPSVRPPRPSVPPDGGPRGQQLQSLVDRIGEMEEVRAAVVTDELGLVVASTGDYGEALAAFGALLADVGTRAGQLLPMHTLHEVSIRDEHEVTVTVRPLDTDDAELALVTMGIGPSAESEVARLIESGA